MKRRLLWCIFGITLIALGIAICRVGQVGVDPSNGMYVGVADFIGHTLGVTSLGFQLVFFILVLIFNRKYISYGTFMNAIGSGFLIDLFTFLIPKICGSFDTSGILIKVICLVAGLLIMTLGVSLYFTGNLGLAPYDALGRILNERTKLAYPVCRILTDVLCVVVGLIFGGPIGVGTVIIAFGTGPLIQFWNKKVSQPLLRWKSVK